jgi:hypothetical protein
VAYLGFTPRQISKCWVRGDDHFSLKRREKISIFVWSDFVCEIAIIHQILDRTFQHKLSQQTIANSQN